MEDLKPGNMSIDDIRKKLDNELFPDKSSKEAINLEPLPTKRTKLGRPMEAEEFLKKRGNSGKNSDIDLDDTHDIEIEDSDIEDKPKMRDPIQEAKDNRVGDLEQVSDNTGNKKNGVVNSAIGFFQSIVLIIISGAILLTFGLWTWKALSNTSSDLIYEDITENIGVLTGSKNIEDTDNLVWGYVEQITKVGELEVYHIETNYVYDKKRGLVIIDYKNGNLTVNSKDIKLKFKKKGKVFAEVIEDKDGNVIDYTILEIIK